MRLLIINPNTTDALTEKICALAARSAASDTQIIGATAPFGAAYISSAEESAVAVEAVQKTLADRAGNYDAAMIASSSDSGLAEARAATDRPVTAMTESALLVACQLGKTFSIITLQQGGMTLLPALVDQYGLSSRLAGVRLGMHLEGGTAPDLAQLKKVIIESSRQTVSEDGAEVVIVGGASVAGDTAELSRAVGVPVLDGISSGVKMAEALSVCA